MRSGKWWPWVVAWGLVAGTMAVMVAAAIRAPGTTPGTTDILGWGGAVFGLGTAAVTTFRWAGKKTHDPPARLATERIRTARGLLAVAVEEQWTNEARFRDWEKQPLIQVRWRAPVDPRVPSHAGAVRNAPQAASSAEIDELAAKFRACEPRRLVILGGPGTGKTTLAVRLLLELLATRAGREHEPVPVTLPVAQWDTDRYPRLQAWLSAQLHEDYPGLQWLGTDGVRQMVDLGHVLPILDGLDELPEPAHATVIERLNDSLGARDQLILTSRTAEYTDAVGSGRALESAAVLEPLPVTPLAAADYLKGALQSHQANQPAWAKALDALRTEPGSALAEVAATPLGLWLLRTVYVKGDGDPGELTDPTRFPTPDRLRAYLFDHLIEAFLPPDGDKGQAKSLGLGGTYRAGDVKWWLAFLAHRLTNNAPRRDADDRGTRDFAWWRLAAIIGKAPTPPKIGLVFGLVFWHVYALMLLLGFGLMDRLPTLLAVVMVLVLLAVLVLGLVAMLVLRLTSGLITGTEVKRLRDDQPGYARLRTPRGLERSRPKRAAGLMSGLGFVLGLGLVYVLRIDQVLGLGGGFVYALGLGLVFGLIRWIETPTPAAQVITPQVSLQVDRTLNRTRIILSFLGGGLPLGLVFGHGGGLVRLVFGLVCGLVGACAGLAFGRHRAWLAYIWATWRLSREGVLPRKLMPFLNDMHRLGLLRAVGRIYQFRHAELQDHLAAAYRRAG